MPKIKTGLFQYIVCGILFSLKWVKSTFKYKYLMSVSRVFSLKWVKSTFKIKYLLSVSRSRTHFM